MQALILSQIMFISNYAIVFFVCMYVYGLSWFQLMYVCIWCINMPVTCTSNLIAKICNQNACMLMSKTWFF